MCLWRGSNVRWVPVPCPPGSLAIKSRCSSGCARSGILLGESGIVDLSLSAKSSDQDDTGTVAGLSQVESDGQVTVRTMSCPYRSGWWFQRFETIVSTIGSSSITRSWPSCLLLVQRWLEICSARPLIFRASIKPLIIVTCAGAQNGFAPHRLGSQVGYASEAFHRRLPDLDPAQTEPPAPSVSIGLWQRCPRGLRGGYMNKTGVEDQAGGASLEKVRDLLLHH